MFLLSNNKFIDQQQHVDKRLKIEQNEHRDQVVIRLSKLLFAYLNVACYHDRFIFVSFDANEQKSMKVKQNYWSVMRWKGGNENRCKFNP